MNVKKIGELLAIVIVLVIAYSSVSYSSGSARLLCLGDSQTWVWSWQNAGYCEVLDQMRDDFEVTNAGLSADTSEGAFVRLKAFLFGRNKYEVVTILIGSNDVKFWATNPNQPRDTVETIYKMVRHALHNGADYVVVMTPTPASYAERNNFVKAVSELMLQRRWSPARSIKIVDLYKFFEGQWDATNTFDGVHINQQAAAKIADLLADAIPAQ